MKKYWALSACMVSLAFAVSSKNRVVLVPPIYDGSHPVPDTELAVDEDARGNISQESYKTLKRAACIHCSCGAASCMAMGGGACAAVQQYQSAGYGNYPFFYYLGICCAAAYNFFPFCWYGTRIACYAGKKRCKCQVIPEKHAHFDQK